MEGNPRLMEAPASVYLLQLKMGRNLLVTAANLDRSGVAASKEAPEQEHDNRSDHCTDQPGSLVRAVPAQCLPQKGRQESTRDAQNGRQDEACGLVGAWVKEFSDDASDKADHDGPENTHSSLPAM